MGSISRFCLLLLLTLIYRGNQFQIDSYLSKENAGNHFVRNFFIGVIGLLIIFDIFFILLSIKKNNSDKVLVTKLTLIFLVILELIFLLGVYYDVNVYVN